MMSARAGAALDEIVGQVHHFAEAVIHHRKPPVGAEHAQAVRHVVQRGIELAGQRRLALARHDSACMNILCRLAEMLHDRQQEMRRMTSDMAM